MDRLELTPVERSLIEAVGRGEVWSPAYYRDWLKRQAVSEWNITTFDAGDGGPARPGDDDSTADDGTGGGDDDQPIIPAGRIRDLILGQVPEDQWPGWFAVSGVRIRGARITGPLDLRAQDYDRLIQINDCVFDSPVVLDDARLRRLSLSGCAVPSVSGIGAQVAGDVDFSRLSAQWLSLRSAHINGFLKLDAARLEGGHEVPAEGKILDCEAVRINGSLLMGEEFVARGPVRLEGGRIGVHLCCDGGRIENIGGVALYGESLETGGSIFLRDGFSAQGEVILRRSRVAGQLNCSGGRFENPGKRALNCNGLETGADTFLNHGFAATGDVIFRRAQIGMKLDCCGGRFDAGAGLALDLDMASVGASALLSEGFVARGQVNLTGASLNGQLVCEGGQFENPGDVALGCYAARIGADVFLTNGFSAKGRVNFVRIRIQGDLQCFEGTFSNPDDIALDLEKAEISSTLFLCQVKRLEGEFHLRDAKVRNFADDGTAWPEKGKLILDGFQYEAFTDNWVPSSARTIRDGKNRRRWLLRQYPADLYGNFKPQPWSQLARVLREEGREEDARYILRKRASWRLWHQRPQGWQWLEWPFSFLWGILTGHGYAMRRPLIMIFVIVLMGWGVFRVAQDLSLMRPAPPLVALDENRMAMVEAPDSPYENFRPWLYSLDLFVPFTALHQESFWIPRDAGERGAGDAEGHLNLTATYPGLKGSPRWLITALEGLLEAGFVKWWFWFEIIAGWVFTSIVVVGFSGLLRRDE